MLNAAREVRVGEWAFRRESPQLVGENLGMILDDI
jgi:hypothetical protein